MVHHHLYARSQQTHSTDHGERVKEATENCSTPPTAAMSKLPKAGDLADRRLVSRSPLFYSVVDKLRSHLRNRLLHSNHGPPPKQMVAGADAVALV